MKRIFYMPDGTVSVMAMARPIKDGEDVASIFDHDMGKFDDLKALPFDDVEDDSVPKRDENRDKWRYRDIAGKKELFIDNTIRLKREIIKDADDALDAELAKSNPDPVKVIKLQRDRENAIKLPPKYHERKEKV